MSSEWHARSFFLEIKPRTDLASLFVDCPPNGDGEDKENNSLDMVRVTENSIELGLPPAIAEHLTDPTVSPSMYRARIAGLQLSPDSVCSPTWADNRRLFMCKVKAGTADKQPIVPKQFHRLAKEMLPTAPLEAFVKDSAGKTVKMTCSQCSLLLIEPEQSLSIGWLPSDDWLSTSPAVDYYCRDTCGAACDPNRHGHATHRGGVESETMHSNWSPTEQRLMLTHSYTISHTKCFGDRVKVESSGIVACAGCHSQLGVSVKNSHDLLMLNHACCALMVDDQSFLSYRFPVSSMFYTQLLLSSCESMSSLKLVVRSLDKTPHLLVWLLDSYVIVASGDLQKEKEEKDASVTHIQQDDVKSETGGQVVEGVHDQADFEIKPFPAVKMLYKVFDAESAASDPRANGEDASVGLVDLPLPCCLQLMESLLLSSHHLPPACRSVGQFYVGFQPLSDSL